MPTSGPTNPDRDTTVASSFATNNYGVFTTLVLDWLNPGECRGLLSWDMSPIPVGAIILSATLNMVVQTNTLALETDCGAYPMTNTPVFVEGTGNGSATGDGATWNTVNGSTAWGTAGGDYDTNYKSVFQIAPGDTTKSIDVKTALQAALDNYRDVNNRVALLLKRDIYSGASNSYRLWSKEAGTPANRPTLTVEYMLPGGAGVPTFLFEDED